MRWAAPAVVLTCLTVFVGGLLPEYHAYHAAFQRAETVTASLARLFAQQAEDTVALSDAGILTLRTAVERGTAPEEAIAVIRKSKEKGSAAFRNQSFAFADATGRIRAASDLNTLTALDVSDVDQFRQHEQSPDRALVIGAPLMDPVTLAWSLSLSRRVDNRDGSFAGVIAATTDLAYFERFYAEAIGDHRMTVVLARDDATLLARYPNATGMFKTKLDDPAHFREILRPDAAGIFRTISPLDQMDRVIAYRAGGQYPIAAFASQSVDDIVAEWRGPALQHTGLRLAMAVVLGVIGLWGLRQLRRRVSMAATIAEREAEFRALAEGSRDPILRLDAAGIIRYASPATLHLFEHEPEVLIGRHVSEFAVAEDLAAVLIGLGSLTPDDSDGTTIGFGYDDSTGGRRWYAMAIRAAARTSDHSFIATVRDVTLERRRELALTQEAQTDPLTGLANRRQFDATIAAEWRRAARGAQPLSLLFFDADRFKRFNDSYGHAQGDVCLIAIAKAISAGANRVGDLAARFGGEEFVLLLPATDSDGAHAIAEAIRLAIVALAIPHSDNPPYGVATVSIGIATAHPAPDATSGADDLLQTADRALYAAKAGGRNRAVFAEPILIDQGMAI